MFGGGVLVEKRGSRGGGNFGSKREKDQGERVLKGAPAKSSSRKGGRENSKKGGSKRVRGCGDLEQDGLGK